ncbi:hypothetical protein EYF80_061535 [Liparis tanakae]|uniref:Uncharacterized protein n=1 Tax=Liparis tanakae TaxID=230148 RepID=A0A4Z2EHC0_9TELE|nr:hypothetical protein EYF80_061535 [Liparis tanakae]
MAQITQGPAAQRRIHGARLVELKESARAPLREAASARGREGSTVMATLRYLMSPRGGTWRHIIRTKPDLLRVVVSPRRRAAAPPLPCRAAAPPLRQWEGVPSSPRGRAALLLRGRICK